MFMNTVHLKSANCSYCYAGSSLLVGWHIGEIWLNNWTDRDATWRLVTAHACSQPSNNRGRFP